MTTDRSLEEFLDGDAGGDADSPGDASADAPADEPAVENTDVRDESAEDLVVAPAQATHDWSPDGAVCAVCDAAVERRWRAGEATVADADVADPDAMVCDDCKVW